MRSSIACRIRHGMKRPEFIEIVRKYYQLIFCMTTKNVLPKFQIFESFGKLPPKTYKHSLEDMDATLSSLSNFRRSDFPI
jgi:hypothetical protein